MDKKVTVENVKDVFQLESICSISNITREITVSDLNRPGLEFAGFFKYYPSERIQILGKTELTFVNGLDPKVRRERLEKLCQDNTPCIIIARNLDVPEEMLEIAKKKKIPILRTSMNTTRFASKLTGYLETQLAPSQTIHGVLIDVNGVGILLIGSSGIGKSETALELVKRGHRLVADDVVEMRQAANEIFGTAPEIVRHLLEIRGVGIINVMTLFGAGAVKIRKKITLVIKLEMWEKDKNYDRLGLDEQKMRLMDTDMPLITIPVRPGRNLAVIIEVAAMNYRLKLMGYNAAKDFSTKLSEEMDLEVE